jgi:hypothetical protein
MVERLGERDQLFVCAMDASFRVIGSTYAPPYCSPLGPVTHPKPGTPRSDSGTPLPKSPTRCSELPTRAPKWECVIPRRVHVAWKAIGTSPSRIADLPVAAHSPSTAERLSWEPEPRPEPPIAGAGTGSPSSGPGSVIQKQIDLVPSPVARIPGTVAASRSSGDTCRGAGATSGNASSGTPDALSNATAGSRPGATGPNSFLSNNIGAGLPGSLRPTQQEQL